MKQKEVYAVLNDNFTASVKDQIAYVFLDKEKAEKYARESSELYGIEYYVEPLPLGEYYVED